MDFHSRRQQDALIVSTTRTGGASVVSVGGEIDVYTAPRLRAELARVLDDFPDGPVFLDLTAVTFIGSAGLAILVDAHAQAERRSRPFGLVVDHFADAVIRPLQTAGLTGLFATYSDVAEAIAQSM
jgi:anti-sigma B factor antagonist